MRKRPGVLPLIVIDDARVRELLTPRACRDVVREALIAFANGTAQNPVRNVISTGIGWFATMPASIAGDGAALGAKLVAAFPGNAAQGLPTHRAIVVLLDPQTGVPQAIVDADAITQRRTAAVSVLAAERLGRTPGKLALLGAGVQGHAHLEAFADADLVTSVAVWSRTAYNAEALAAQARQLGFEARACATAREAARDADVIVTATGAAEPILDSDDVRDGALIAAVGACVATRRELGTALVARAALYADDEAAARVESGDLLIAERELGHALAIEASLGATLASPRKRERENRPTVFISLGLGIEDVACARFVAAAQKAIAA